MATVRCRNCSFEDDAHEALPSHSCDCCGLDFNIAEHSIRSCLQKHAGWDEYRKLSWDVDGNKSRF